MQLIDLLAQVLGVEALPDHAALSAEVKGLTTNSLTCQPGDLFIGMPGTRVDGGDFWHSAIAAGAIAAIVSPQAAANAMNDSAFKTQTPPLVIASADMTQTCAAIAAAFYNFPATKLKLVGVTGTNGKTTTTHLIEFLLEKSQKPAALFGTLYTRWSGFQQIALHTTPFAIDLQRQFSDAIAAGCQVGVMEVSSHALAQGRVRGCPFDVAVFTNPDARSSRLSQRHG